VITCDECGRENDDEYKFCLGCGAALEEADEGGDEEEGSELINCPYCGAEQPANFKFCGSCGEQIPEDIAAAGSDDGGEAEEAAASASSDDHPTSPGTPGAEESGAGDGRRADPEPAKTAEGAQSTPGQSQPGTAAAAGDRGDPPPMPSDLSEDAAQGRREAGASGEVVEDAIAELIVIRPDGTEGASLDLPKDKLTIGRASDLEALSGDPFLSPKHAAILHQNGQFIVQDDDSLNGIFREVTDAVELQSGDLIRIGQELLEFERFEDDPHEGDEPPLSAGSEDPGNWGRLRLIAGPDVYTEGYALEEDEITVGRETGDIVFQEDGFVSGTHAQFTLEEGRPVLRDLNSSNGTFIRIRDDYPLDNGERVLMGQQLFRLEVG